ncbi:hypothetical protein [Planctomicrobium sp. SH664]|uniref:hypothetical protein n=1 Tax=Planctomicrobium sp. SH664 TaxID=3448125 RepID=UPI003F5BBE23
MYENDLYQLPEKQRRLVEEELSPGEKVVWIGQPLAARQMLRTIPVVLFSIPFTGFAMFWMFAAAGFRFPRLQRPEDFFALFGIPFLCIGLGMMSAPYWQLLRTRRTVYVVTDRRAMIISGIRTTRISSFLPHQFLTIKRTQRPDGTGDVTFGIPAMIMQQQKNFVVTSHSEEGFFDIRDSRHVEGLVRELAGQDQAGETVEFSAED